VARDAPVGWPHADAPQSAQADGPTRRCPSQGDRTRPAPPPRRTAARAAGCPCVVPRIAHGRTRNARWTIPWRTRRSWSCDDDRSGALEALDGGRIVRRHEVREHPGAGRRREAAVQRLSLTATGTPRAVRQAVGRPTRREPPRGGARPFRRRRACTQFAVLCGNARQAPHRSLWRWPHRRRRRSQATGGFGNTVHQPMTFGTRINRVAPACPGVCQRRFGRSEA